MNDLSEFISKINISNEHILGIKCISEKQSIVFLKKEIVDSYFFIEILDLNHKRVKRVILDSLISNIKNFHPIDSQHFYINAIYNGETDSHLKINIDGQILYHKIFDTEIVSLNNKIILKDFIFREDLKLLDLKDFKEYELEDFMIDNFQDKCDFIFQYFSESYYKTFSLSNNNILGLEIYDKDGDPPRMYFIVLQFDSPSSINILFEGKIDDCGHHYLLNQNATEIAYRSTFYLSDDTIKFRKLLPNEFTHFENLDSSIDENSNNNHDNFEYENLIYFNEKIIVILYSNELENFDRIEIRNRKKSNHEKNVIYIDKGKLYDIMNGKLFFVRNSKFNYIEISQ